MMTTVWLDTLKHTTNETVPKCCIHLTTYWCSNTIIVLFTINCIEGGRGQRQDSKFQWDWFFWENCYLSKNIQPCPEIIFVCLLNCFHNSGYKRTSETTIPWVNKKCTVPKHTVCIFYIVLESQKGCWGQWHQNLGFTSTLLWFLVTFRQQKHFW